jgi:hypothetical protein
MVGGVSDDEAHHGAADVGEPRRAAKGPREWVGSNDVDGEADVAVDDAQPAGALDEQAAKDLRA